MKYRKIASVITALILSAAVTVSASALSSEPQAATTQSVKTATTTQATYTKNEDVYAKLNTDGSVQGTYVVNAYTVKSGGTITDYGNYDAVKNLTDLSEIKNADGVMNFQTEKGNFYYQGNIANAKLPWDVKLTYTLNGNATEAKTLTGASGKLAINIATAANASADSAFYKNYLLQVTVTLDPEKCKNIEAPDSSIADAGAKKKVTFTVMPDTAGAMTVNADVTDFEMDSISIAAVPFSMSISMPDTSDMTDGLNDLANGISDLDGGVQDLNDGMKALSANAKKLKSGSGKFADGLDTISGKSAGLTAGSAQILGALQLIDSSLQTADFSGLSSLASLPASLNQLSAALGQVKGGISGLQSGFSGAYSALDKAIGGVSGGISESELGALAAANAGNSAFDKLLSDYTAAQTIKGTYAHVKPAFEAVKDNLPTLAASIGQVQDGIDTMSAGITKAFESNDLTAAMASLKSGIHELATNYGAFNGGLTQYMDGVHKLSTNFSDFNSGLAKYLDGVISAKKGTGKLADGTSELADQTKDMPDKMTEEINKMKDKYDYSGFKPVSFTDARNTNIGAVQFVITTESIEKPEEKPAAAAEKEKSFFDRLAELFK